MRKEFRGKVFKSGNSVALRLPKVLGAEAGDEMRIIPDERRGFKAEPVQGPKRKFDIDKVWGIGRHLDLQPIADEDRIFEHRPLLWDDPEWLASLPADEK